MVNSKKYIEALAIVNEYKSQLSESLVQPRVCSCCKSNIVKPIECGFTDPLKQESGMWSDGVVEKITFGYGSIHDMESYYIAICDECIVNLEREKLATNIRDIRNDVRDFEV